MNILITHQFYTLHGGSFIYTQEISNLLKFNHDVVTINDNHIDHNFDIEIICLDDVRKINFDLIIIMQAGHFKTLDIKINNARIVNIIHSEVYDCDLPLINNRVKYIAVRQEIKDYLINRFNISPDKITILLNPISKKFYEISTEQLDDFYEKKFGIFVCSSLGQIRHKAIVDFALFCHELNYKSLLVAPVENELKNNIEKIYDKILEPCDDINKYVQKSQVCGGILKGRTYWEAKLCGKPTVEYMVDSNGNILDEIHEMQPSEEELKEIKNATDPKYVANKILEIANIENNFILDEYFNIIYNLSEKNNFLHTKQIKPIEIDNYLNYNIMNKIDMENILNYNQVLLHANFNKYENIMIIQNNSVIKENINKVFYDKFNLFKSDWEILIFSSDFSGVALTRNVYIELLENIKATITFDHCLTTLISKYKTYIFKDNLIKFL
jgi:hypothetical protein